VPDTIDPGPEKLRRMQAVTDSALSSLEFGDLLTELLERTCDLMRAHTTVVLLLDATGSELVVTATGGAGDVVRPDARVRIGDGLAGQAAVLAQAQVVNYPATDGGSEPFLQPDAGFASAVSVPILTASRVTGVLYTGKRENPFSSEDVELLRLVADRASLAVQAHLSESDRAATLALQRSLLPARPAPIPGLEVAARYIPGGQAGVGGDWYDLFHLPSGHVGLVIGDVAGSGLHAAIVMGRIRSALRAYALETTDPADVLTRLDRKIQLFEPGAMATAIYGVVDPARARMDFSVAGHLLPATIPSGGGCRLLEAPIDLPLGAYPDALRHITSVEVGPETGLLFYTDGLVERRGHSLTASVGALLRRLSASTADGVCAEAIGHLHDSAASDDVAVLAVRPYTKP
jgi:hypothetical protein